MRRGVRISANFWIGMEGIDPRPELRRGNLSGTGIYFESSQLVGPRGTMDYLVPAGSMQFLHVASEDRKVVVQVLARIIRVSDINDMLRGKTLGLAVEFMPATHLGRQNLARLVRHVVELGLQEDQTGAEVSGVDLGPVQDSHLRDTPLENTDRSSLRALDVQKLTMETNWKAKVGDTMEVFIRRPNAISGQPPLSSALMAQVTSVNEIANLFRIDLRITGRTVIPEQIPLPVPEQVPGQVMATFSEMISESYQDFDLPARDHLSGLLSRIQLPTLLSLIEMEQMTGALRVNSQDSKSGEEIALFIRRGRLIDASSSLRAALSIRQLLTQVMSWTEGHFQFEVEAIDDDERLGSSLTEMILDITTKSDEARRK